MLEEIRLNKEIFDAKLAITTDCILRCKYCFVNKDCRYMGLSTAKKAIDLVLNSPGRDKILRIYGGEPLLHFGLIEEMTSYIYKKASEKQKRLTLTLCTNSILLDDCRIGFFKKNNFKLAISLDGKRAYHDHYRVYANKASSFEGLFKNIPIIFKQMHKRNLAAALSVLPATSSSVFENFKYVLRLGFDTINIEPIYNFGVWTNEKRKCFFENMMRILSYILNSINNKKFIFLTTINRELRYRSLSKMAKGKCHFWNTLEFYPDGEMGFSSFMLNKLNRQKFIIGNINKGIQAKYRNCRYSSTSIKCEQCKLSYFANHKDYSLSSSVVEQRNLISIKASQEIERRSLYSRNFKEYVMEAKKHICF